MDHDVKSRAGATFRRAAERSRRSPTRAAARYLVVLSSLAGAPDRRVPIQRHLSPDRGRSTGTATPAPPRRRWTRSSKTAGYLGSGDTDYFLVRVERLSYLEVGTTGSTDTVGVAPGPVGVTRSRPTTTPGAERTSRLGIGLRPMTTTCGSPRAGEAIRGTIRLSFIGRMSTNMAAGDRRPRTWQRRFPYQRIPAGQVTPTISRP